MNMAMLLNVEGKDLDSKTPARHGFQFLNLSIPFLLRLLHFVHEDDVAVVAAALCMSILLNYSK